MDKKNNNQISVCLMVVGIIFIIVAGTVFVSKAWKYMPAYAKQLLLLVIAVSMFAGAYQQERKGVMKKTAAALYYLGTSFLGLLILSTFGGATKSNLAVNLGINWNETAIIFSGIAMLSAVVLRFVKERTALDFVLMALLADWICIWVAPLYDYSIVKAGIISAFCMIVYVIAYLFLKHWSQDKQGVENAFIVLFTLHAVSYGMHIVMVMLFSYKLVFAVGNVIMIGSLVFITSLLFIVKKGCIFRICNSFAIFGFIYSIVHLGSKLFGDTEIWSIKLMPMFLTFLLCMIVTVIVKRQEMIISMITFGMIIPFIQILLSESLIGRIWMYHENVKYLPFTGVMMAGMAIVLVQVAYHKMMTQKEMIRYGAAIGIQIIPLLITRYAAYQEVGDKAYLVLITCSMLTIAMLFSETLLQKICYTLALFFGVLTCISYTLVLVPNGYQKECMYLCCFVGLVLIEMIWKIKDGGMKLCKFICVCYMMASLLIQDIVAGGLGNALLLGAFGVIILIAGTISSQKNYVILASVILMILAFYFTRAFWLSIAWWIYLFAAGVGLLVLAVKKEKMGGV